MTCLWSTVKQDAELRMRSMKLRGSSAKHHDSAASWVGTCGARHDDDWFMQHTEQAQPRGPSAVTLHPFFSQTEHKVIQLASNALSVGLKSGVNIVVGQTWQYAPATRRRGVFAPSDLRPMMLQKRELLRKVVMIFQAHAMDISTVSLNLYIYWCSNTIWAY